MEEKTRKMGVFRRIFFIVGIVLIVLFGTMLVCNLILIVKGFIEPEKPPALFGIVLMAVKSGSMSGDAKDHIELDDLIFIGKADEESLKAGDVIAYLGEDRTVVTHRIVSIERDEAGQTVFITKGDANNTTDAPVERSALIGVYRGRIPKLGVCHALANARGHGAQRGRPHPAFLRNRFDFPKEKEKSGVIFSAARKGKFCK